MWIKGIFDSLIHVFGDRLVYGVILTAMGYIISLIAYHLSPYFFSMSNQLMGYLLYLLGIGIGGYFSISGLDTLFK